MPHVCLQHLLGGPASEPNPLRYTDFASSEQSIPSFSSPPHTRSHSKPIARKFQNGFLQEAVSGTLRRSAFPPARDSPRRSVPDTALTLNAPLQSLARHPPTRSPFLRVADLCSNGSEPWLSFSDRVHGSNPTWMPQISKLPPTRLRENGKRDWLTCCRIGIFTCSANLRR
jgi:hypothetical protein